MVEGTFANVARVRSEEVSLRPEREIKAIQNIEGGTP